MSANSNVKKAYFVLSEKVIAQGFFNPDIDWKGFRVPLFTIDECERLINILKSQEDVAYRFTRNENNSGYILTDLKETGQVAFEQADSTIIFNDEPITVNGLADGWCWEEISEDLYKEWNILIKQGEVVSTVEHLRKA